MLVHLTRGLADPGDQVANTPHGVIEIGCQRAQLVAAVHFHVHGHVAVGYLPHQHGKALEGPSRCHVEAGVQIDDQQTHGRQGDDQHRHGANVLTQSLGQHLTQRLQHGLVEGVGLVYLGGQLVEIVQPASAQGAGQDDIVLEDPCGDVQALQTDLARGSQTAEFLAGQHQSKGLLVIAPQGLHALEQVVHVPAGVGVQITQADGIGAHCAAIAQRLGNGRGLVDQQIGQLTNITIIILRQTGIGGTEAQQ